MAKSANQKLKLLYIIKILQEHTDENHAITTQQLIESLAKEDIRAERKSIYSDIALLTEFGYDIISSKAKDRSGYYLGSRDFELAELKVLVDAVQASRFVTAKKSKELISKLEKLTSPFEAKQLQRQVYVSDRVKNSNESIYYSIDVIHRAMQDNKQISFKYYEWGVDKQMHFRRNGTLYIVSPYHLIWNDENYYLVAFDARSQEIRHYRVDKMAELSVRRQDREGRQQAESFQPAKYADRNFGMYAGREETVTLQFPQKLSGVMFDRFGREVDIRKRGEDSYSIRATVAVSGQFFGWLTGLSREVKLIAPQAVVHEYRAYLDAIRQLYD